MNVLVLIMIHPRINQCGHIHCAFGEKHSDIILFHSLICFRLRHIVKKLQKDDISKEDLIKNLEYAASVLETVYIDETRSDIPFFKRVSQ